MISKEAILERADELLSVVSRSGLDPNPTNEALSGTLTLLRLVHGPGSVHEGQLIQAMKVAANRKEETRGVNLHDFVVPVVTGALKPLKADVDAGVRRGPR
jgi:hypothetical protein